MKELRRRRYLPTSSLACLLKAEERQEDIVPWTTQMVCMLIDLHGRLVNVPDPRSSPASISGQKISRNTRTSKGTRTSLLAEVSTIGGRQGSKGSVDQGTDDGQKDDEDDGEAMGEDENDSKAATLKDTSKASKGAAIKSNASRRSGRKR